MRIYHQIVLRYLCYFGLSYCITIRNMIWWLKGISVWAVAALRLINIKWLHAWAVDVDLSVNVRGQISTYAEWQQIWEKKSPSSFKSSGAKTMDQSHVIPRQRGHWPILRLKNSYHTLCNMVPHFFCKYCTVNQSRYGHYNSAPLPQIRCATNITQKNIERKLLVETNVQTLLPNNSNLRDCCRLTGR